MMNNCLIKMKCNINFVELKGSIQDTVVPLNLLNNYEVQFKQFEMQSNNEYSGEVSVFSDTQKEGEIDLESLLLIVELAGSKRFDSSVTSIKDIKTLAI